MIYIMIFLHPNVILSQIYLNNEIRVSLIIFYQSIKTIYMINKSKLQTNFLSYLILLSLLILAQTSPSIKTQVSLCQQILLAISNKDEALLNKSISLLEEKVYEPCLLELLPKYFWAQNMTHLLVKFQFLNSADTSACSRVLFTNKNVQHSEISLSLICLQSNLLLRYRIKIKTFMPLNFYRTQWKTIEQNSLLLISPKSPSPYFWKSLYLPKHAPMRKPKIWWKMIQKYRDDLAKFIYDLQVQDQQEQVSAWVRKQKKIRRYKFSEFYISESSTYLYCNHNNPFQLGSWLS